MIDLSRLRHNKSLVDFFKFKHSEKLTIRIVKNSTKMNKTKKK